VLLLVLLVAAAWVFGRGKRRKVEPPAAKAAPPKPAPPAKAGEVLACAHCGVHAPASEVAFDLAGLPYCSAEHRVAGPR
jgi:uncharacterized protein